MTEQEGGDLIALRIHETKKGDNILDAFHAGQDRKVLEEIEAGMAKKRQNIDTRIVASESIPEAIIETIASEHADLVLMNWDGHVNTKGFIFGRKIDVVLHRAKCDMLTVKLGTGKSMARIFIPVAIDANPNLRFTGKVATALHRAFGSQVTVGMVLPLDVEGEAKAHYMKLLDERIRELKMKIPAGSVEAKLFQSDYLASGIVKAGSGYDVVLLPAARNRLTKAIGVGSIPEQVAKNCRRKTVLIAKGYRGIAQPFWEYLSQRL
jgi:nucleotide-binding universal stress UspA family protein